MNRILDEGVNQRIGEVETPKVKPGKHVVIVCDLLSTFLRFRLPVALRLVSLGHHVTLITSDADCDDERLAMLSAQGLSVELIRMDRTGMNPFKDASYARRLRKAFLRLRPNRILAYQAKCATWSAIAARSVKGCKVAILFPGLGYLFAPSHGMRAKLVKLAARQLCRFAYSSVDIAIFQNDEDRETLANCGIGLHGATIHRVNGSGVDLEQFPYSECPGNPIRFCMATRLLADKGIPEFVEAARHLKSKFGERVQFTIAGKYDRAPSAIRESEMDLWVKEGIIDYVGLVDDMQGFLKAASVFVLPSYYMEGTPRSILEALASGRAVIATDQRGCRETVDDEINGFLVPVRNADALAGAMERFVESPGLLSSMGKESRRLAESKYDVEIVARQMTDALEL
ncbi:glycosyltransferase family 4 protein [Roseiconus lacunae]|uniref:glycosyltransferase family 4 protein n=1 Tax=Roseiconus lacunae TaxID=2605694 RepID=UPI0011F24B5F|nr:glycosyltransferase family 4 protein [Roseiconus lacunae]